MQNTQDKANTEDESKHNENKKFFVLRKNGGYSYA